jgi:hypothetical protein
MLDLTSYISIHHLPTQPTDLKFCSNPQEIFTMAVIQPYKIAVPQDKLDILKKKLDLVTFPDELDDAEWSRGSPLADIKRLAAYWRDSYDWHKTEAQLNEFPQFITDIAVDGYETFKIHFIHQKSEVKNAIPLIFVHGWPGSFDEVSKILPELVRGGKDTPAFHVVAPSLVNFGFSEGTKKVCSSSMEGSDGLPCYSLG